MIIELLCSDGSTMHSDAEMAANFNNYFSSVFTSEDTTTIPSVHAIVSSPIIDSIDITPEVVFNKIYRVVKISWTRWLAHTINKIYE